VSESELTQRLDAIEATIQEALKNGAQYVVVSPATAGMLVALARQFETVSAARDALELNVAVLRAELKKAQKMGVEALRRGMKRRGKSVGEDTP
jgi:fructose-1-phosphate kinase PfkB-like protein